MSLYGDLPPTEGQKDTPDISSGWAKPKLNNIVKKSSKDEKKKIPVIINNSPPQPKPVAPPKPSPEPATQPTSQSTTSSTISAPKFAPFKPRQTNKSVVNTITVNTPLSAPKPASSINISLPTETVIRKKIHEASESKNDQENLVTLSNQEIEPAVVDFGNATYDVTDPYDPSKPNDYLKYCEEKLERKRQKQIEEENKRAVEETERLRLAVERERAKAMEEGDLARVQATLVGSGRGRGRGVTNLPAWMTASSDLPKSGPETIGPTLPGQFEDSSDYDSRKRKSSFDASSNLSYPSSRGF